MGYAAEKHRQQLAKITALMEDKGLVGTFCDCHGRRIALLDLPGAVPIPSDRIDAYTAQRVRAETGDIRAMCYYVAHQAVLAGAATGVLHGNRTQEFSGWDNHRINYDELPDGTVVALDFTARENLLARRDPQFDVFAIRAANLDALLEQTAELYTGQWHNVPPDDWQP